MATIEGENGPVRIKNICADWVQIEYKDAVGWVALEWLCGNPVTTCP
ncbi:hypothetical protein [Olleya sp. YS]|nr:hypothetical protein [Olleya sp. YS]WGD34533.1 hypothetical protein Ollyesu_12180 [Olleya sp. YS]